MLSSESFGTAFFIGGMEGVEQEYDLLKRWSPSVPRFLFTNSIEEGADWNG